VIVRSLALTTELALAAMRGRVTDRDDYIVVETPDNPGYYDGNVLVLPAPPQVGEVAYWTRRFGDELGKDPAIKHVSLWWDGTNGDEGAATELRAAGFVLMSNQVMVAERGSRAGEQPSVYAVAPSAPLVTRVLAPDEVLATADLAYTLGDRHDDSYRLFLDRRAAWHSELVTRGLAKFWGTFDGELLVASLGLVWLGKLARYQDVQTLPSHRRRGLAGALLSLSSHDAFARGAERVVIIAEPESEAARVYARLGFRTVERTVNARRV
jgi:ribosomal protein S18 acetylase RimI-like enzyme